VVDAPLTFVDTNVLAYAHDRSETAKQPVAWALLDRLWRDRAGILSTQVLQEHYVVVTRTFDPPMPRGVARDLVVLYATWPVVQVDSAVSRSRTPLAERLPPPTSDA
jgi:predicted nucleic acid-binding protein